MNFIEKVKLNKREYNRLLDLRMAEIHLPEAQKTLKTGTFMRFEKRLNYKGILLREKAGIRVDGVGDVFCRSCGRFFDYRGRSTVRLDFQRCVEHRNLKTTGGI